MNKIVREHYPVANLPDDLRVGLPEGATVRVVIEQEEDAEARAKLEAWAKTYWETKREDRKPISVDEMQEQIRLYRAANPKRVTMEEAVARIRELRDEWDDE